MKTIDSKPVREALAGNDQQRSRKPDSRTPGLRPALFAAYSDLSGLRYDYPLVLGWARGEAAAWPLSDLINEILRKIAPRGADGERLRSRVLRLEEVIRKIADRGGRELLSDAWQTAADHLISNAGDDEREAVRADLEQARAALEVEGDLVNCDAGATADVLTHLWRGAQSRKARAFLQQIDRLVFRLESMLMADAMSSPEAWSADPLKRTMGGAFCDAFDFEALGGAIRSVASKCALPLARRQRVTEALSVLKSQKLFHPNDLSFKDYLFDRCDKAIEAHEARLDEIVPVVRAIGAAELELANRYRESVHDDALARIDRESLKPEQIAQFPSALVLLRGDGDPPDAAGILRAVGAGLPLKVVLISDEILPDSRMEADLASMVVGLNRAFVLQTTSSQLARASGALERGLGGDGPAFFSVYSGCGRHSQELPPYLLAAAATESRALPTFSYDPSGEEWAAQFDVGINPRPAQQWVAHPFTYEDAAHQRTSEAVAFTPIDFAGCDRRYESCFETVAAADWKPDMIPASEFMKLSAKERAGRRPYILSIDAENRLWRRVPNEKLINSATRFARRWRSLQELGGIENSHARRLLEQERSCWKEEKEAELRQLRAEMAAAAPAAPAAPHPESSAAPASTNGASSGAAPVIEEPPKSDEPYVETPRCTSCEECIKVNNRMFVYNENKQAYIADPDAGPYADLVIAAETCQVAIIHPGKPRNPDEPGLDDLLKRAQPFL